MDESTKINEKIKTILEEDNELSNETCYFLTKSLMEEYWERIQEEGINVESQELDDLDEIDVEDDDEIEEVDVEETNGETNEETTTKKEEDKKE